MSYFVAAVDVTRGTRFPSSLLFAHRIIESCAMSGFRYHMTFIDVITTPAAVVKRAESSPPVLKDKADARVLRSQYEQRQMQVQVSNLQWGSQVPGGSGTPFQEMPSCGSYGHPHLCRRPCILFLRGTCEKGGDCGFCHLPHEAKAASFDKQQREFLKSLPAVTVMEMLLPYVRKQVEDNVLPGAGVLLQLFTSEISIRGHRRRRTPRISWRVRCVLERLSLSGLVSVACGAIRGRFPKLLCNELTKLRKMAKDLAAA
eukprot:s36_g2.t1